MRGKELPIAQAYIQRMADTPQNPRYHGEGSVLDHTLMVLNTFESLKDQFGLTPEEQKILYWAAVLHDIGKPEVTVFEGGRHTSKGHEKAGVPIAREILLQHPEISTEERKKILDLVRWHGFPLRYVLYQWSEDLLKDLNLRTDLRLLAIFTEMDIRGRICDDQDRVVEGIVAFREKHAAKVEYEMGRNREINSIFREWSVTQKNAAWNAVKLQNFTLVEKLLESDGSRIPTTGFYGVVPSNKKVLLTVGPPVSGKSTWLHKHHPDAFTIQLRDFFVSENPDADAHNTGRRLVEFKYYLSLYLRQHDLIIVEGRNMNEALRQEISEIVRDLNAKIEYLVFENSLENALNWNTNADSPVSEDEIRRGFREFDLLHPWEAHNITWIHPEVMEKAR